MKKIAYLNYVKNIDNKEKGFLLKENYNEDIKNFKRIYTDDTKDPTYFLLVSKYKDVIPESIPKDYSFCAFFMKDPRKKGGNYKNIHNQFVEYEKKYSKGLWGLIAFKPYFNEISLKLHTHLGWRKKGELKDYLKGIDSQITWGIYVLDF